MQLIAEATRSIHEVTVFRERSLAQSEEPKFLDLEDEELIRRLGTALLSPDSQSGEDYRPAAADAGSGGHLQHGCGHAAGGHGQSDGHCVEAIPPTRLRPKSLSFTKNAHGHGHGSSCGAGCSHGEGDDDLRSPDLTPRHPGLHAAQQDFTVQGIHLATPSHCQFAEVPKTMSHGGIEVSPCSNHVCCPSVDAAGTSVMQLNGHCDYPGHCVRLRNTFIHVECSNAGDEDQEDCALCGIVHRQRARSADDLEFRRSGQPAAHGASPGASPALRARADPDGAEAAADAELVPPPAAKAAPTEEVSGRAAGGAARQWQWQ
ncbi:unnamed protein product [Prorocentrum cordatum]|uniref:Uncharacterized protein n=1 Tax=Prorocentrum cordatum TaxID=2364126 RepID=A0ABN9SXU8_9DINO|nr:unnamed protein product [Polarella glacialis]